MAWVTNWTRDWTESWIAAFDRPNEDIVNGMLWESGDTVLWEDGNYIQWG